MSSISVYGYDSEILNISELEDFLHHSEEPHKADLPQTSRQRGCPILNLPYELRTHIYSYILPRTVDLPDRGVVWHRATAAIWATNRQVYQECLRLIYGNPTFLIDVKCDKIEFLYQWTLPQGSLIPKRIFNFPDPIVARNRPIMRKFHVRVHQVDGYMGMVKYNYSNPEILARSLRCQVSIFCGFLKEMYEICELRISYHGGDSESHVMLPLVMEPFRQIKTTRIVTVQDPLGTNEGLRTELQDHLTDAYTRNSLMRLPLELREHVYRHALPHTLSTGTGDNKITRWCSGEISILGTCRQVNTEATRVLYATNEFEFSWMLKYPSNHDWQEEVSNCSDYVERSKSLQT